MSGAPSVSVVVASYNYETPVVEALDGLWAQTWRDFEIVVVDDGSADGSITAVRSFANAHAGGDVSIRLLTHPDGRNHGLPATVELGVRAAHGKYVAFCEADDLWTPDHLEVLASAVGSCGARPALVVNEVELFGDPVRCADMAAVSGRQRRLLHPGLNRIAPAAFRDLNHVLTFSCAMARRDALLACDFNPVGRPSALDWWLWRQLCYSGRILYVDRVLTRWRMHSSQMVSDHGATDYSDRHRQFVVAGSRLLRRQHPLTSCWRLACGAPPRAGSMRKRLRRLLKSLAPYSLQRAYAARTYGISFPREPVCGFLPFGFVCWIKGLDPDNGDAREASSGLQPSYRLPRAVRARLARERAEGLVSMKEEIARNQGLRIVVVLHLYYDAAWPVVAEYLRNLSPYRHDLVVTVTEGRISEKTLSAIRAFAPEVRVFTCANRGFDIWPFARALAELDLARYDVVFKIHAKSVTRPFLYMYGQVFKRWDWFLGLFDGILGGKTAHAALAAIRTGKADLVAAEHLIVADPRHKVRLVRDFCSEQGLPFVEDYRFVAGTCFAARPSALAPFKALGLAESDFEPTRRGNFSRAHALERWICFAAAGRIMGLPVAHVEYPVDVARCRASSPLRLLEDPRFELDAEFFYRVLESRSLTSYEVVRLRLGDIRRKTNDGDVVPLSACAPYRYLCGDTVGYDDYCRSNLRLTGFAMSVPRFEALRASMRSYDPRRMPVVSGAGNVVIDGQHRCCILLAEFGPDHEIDVLRLLF